MNNKICELVGRLANAPQVYIYRKLHKKAGPLEVFGVYGFNVTSLPYSWHLPELDSDKKAAIACRNCEQNDTLQGHPLRKMVPVASSLFAAKLPVESEDSSIYLVAINPEQCLFEDDERLTALRMFVQMLVSSTDLDATGVAPKRIIRVGVLAHGAQTQMSNFSLALA